MLKAHRRLLTLSLVVLDVVAIGIAVTIAYRIASAQGLLPRQFEFFALAIMTIPTAIGLFALNRLYVLDELLEGSVEYGRIAYACTLTTLSLIVFGYWVKNLAEIAPSRKLMVFLWILSVLVAATGRFLARRVVRRLRRRGLLSSRTLIVGLGSPGISLARHFRDTAHAGVHVVGFVDDFLPSGTVVMDGLKVLGPPSALSRIVHDTGVTEIIVVPTAMAWESFQDLLRTAMNLNGHTIRMSPDFREVLATSMKVHQFGFMPLLTIERVRITGLDAVLKRIMDYGAAVSLLPLALPVVTLLSGMLLATGIRPIRRVQTMRRKGGTFTAFWLNTAQPRNDLQQLIFQLRLDKLPQLLNVLLGQMSIVGPRPVPVDEKSEFEQWLPNLFTVKPGITGPWAVGGAWNSIEAEMRSTLFYIRNYTIWLDLDILARSVFRVLAGHERRGGKKEALGHDRAAVYH